MHLWEWSHRILIRHLSTQTGAGSFIYLRPFRLSHSWWSSLCEASRRATAWQFVNVFILASRLACCDPELLTAERGMNNYGFICSRASVTRGAFICNANRNQRYKSSCVEPLENYYRLSENMFVSRSARRSGCMAVYPSICWSIYFVVLLQCLCKLSMITFVRWSGK